MLLHLDSSANRTDESVTRRLTRQFAAAYDDRRYRDLAIQPVQPIDTAFCQLGRRSEQRGIVPLHQLDTIIETPAEEQAWALTKPLVEEVRAADTVVIGAPMYNYSLPAALKAWIDRITFPGAFPEGVLRDTQVVVISASGGAYGAGSPREGWDHETPYLRAYFTNLGVLDVNLTFIRAELTLTGLVPQLDQFTPMAQQSLADAERRISRWRPRAHAEDQVEAYASSGSAGRARRSR
ncbi:FMN-dependent NADH-azoreductase [Kribbella sp. NPDC054772]